MRNSLKSVQLSKSKLGSMSNRSQGQQQDGSEVGTVISAEKVIEMFESKYTEQLTDRKATYIVRFCQERITGFKYSELNQLIKMVQYAITDLFNGAKEMSQALISICETVCKPFQKERASDELDFVPLLPQFLNTFKPLMINNLVAHQEDQLAIQDIHTVQPTLRLAVIKMLKCFCSEGIEDILKQEESLADKSQKQQFEASPMQRLQNNGTKNLRAMDRCDLIEDIIYTMQFYSKKYEFLLPLLEMISNSVVYKSLCQKYTNYGILKDIIYVIFDCDDFRSYIVKSCFEIIWNSIEVVGIQAINLFAAEDIIYSLKKLFENIMKNGYKLEDKCLRNELLILINYLMSDEKALYFFYEKQVSGLDCSTDNSTFLDILLVYSTIDEVTFQNQPLRTNNLRTFFGTSSEDLEFKKLIWSTVLTAIQKNHEEIIQTVKNSQFIMSLLLYIDPLANSYAVNRWSKPQLREIQLHCLSILSNVILYLKDDFQNKNGLFALTKFLTNSTDHDKREKCLRAFNNSSQFEEEYKLKITEEGVLDNLIELLSQEQENPIEIKELCFSIISNLCIDCQKNKRLFRKKGGIDLLVTSLKDLNVAVSARYVLYAVAILDCLWNSILGNKRNETSFLDNQGMYVLLEFLENCDQIRRKMALSSLSYLIENPKSIPYFCDWNSTKSMINATQLLIQIYEKEDIKYGVKYQDGILINKERPLNPRTKQIKQVDEDTNQSIQVQHDTKETQMVTGDHQFEDFYDNIVKVNQTASQQTKGLKEALKSGENDSEAGTEAYLVKRIQEKVEEYDFRAIIFCILYRTGFDRNELAPDQKQKIEVIQMYPHFKIGEIWKDTQYKLKKNNIKPTSDDYHWMMTNTEEFQEIVQAVINTQTMIAKEHRQQQDEDLQKFYDIIKSNKMNK